MSGTHLKDVRFSHTEFHKGRRSYLDSIQPGQRRQPTLHNDTWRTFRRIVLNLLGVSDLDLHRSPEVRFCGLLAHCVACEHCLQECSLRAVQFVVLGYDIRNCHGNSMDPIVDPERTPAAPSHSKRPW